VPRGYKGVEISKNRRQRIINAYHGRCAICGAKPPILTLDHIVPRALGGTTEDSNLQPACPRCNRRKGEAIGCEFWVDHNDDGTGGRPCGKASVEQLVFANPNINSHVHEDGSLHTCASHLATYRSEALL
jgi:HNH endonuclease